MRGEGLWATNAGMAEAARPSNFLTDIIDADEKLPPIEAEPSYPAAGSHSRYAFRLSPEYTAGSGEGIHPDSSVFDE